LIRVIIFWRECGFKLAKERTLLPCGCVDGAYVAKIARLDEFPICPTPQFENLDSIPLRLPTNAIES